MRDVTDGCGEFPKWEKRTDGKNNKFFVLLEEWSRDVGRAKRNRRPHEELSSATGEAISVEERPFQGRVSDVEIVALQGLWSFSFARTRHLRG